MHRKKIVFKKKKKKKISLRADLEGLTLARGKDGAGEVNFNISIAVDVHTEDDTIRVCRALGHTISDLKETGSNNKKNSNKRSQLKIIRSGKNEQKKMTKCYRTLLTGSAIFFFCLFVSFSLITLTTPATTSVLIGVRQPSMKSSSCCMGVVVRLTWAGPCAVGAVQKACEDKRRKVGLVVRNNSQSARRSHA